MLPKVVGHVVGDSEAVGYRELNGLGCQAAEGALLEVLQLPTRLELAGGRW